MPRRDLNSGRPSCDIGYMNKSCYSDCYFIWNLASSLSEIFHHQHLKYNYTKALETFKQANLKLVLDNSMEGLKIKYF